MILQCKKWYRLVKLDNAVGANFIANEVLNQSALQVIMLHFINSYFLYHTIPYHTILYHTIPSARQRAAISHSPKSASEDPYVPLSYRVISPLSCVCRLYSHLIDGRLLDIVKAMTSWQGMYEPCIYIIIYNTKQNM